MARRPRSQAGTTSSLADGLVAATSGSRLPVATVAHPTSEAGKSLADQLVDGTKAPELRPPPVPISPAFDAQLEYVRAAVGQVGTRAPNSPPPLFASANVGDGVKPDFERIIEATFSVDAFADYDDLEKHLEVGDQRGDRSTLREHLDKAEQRARRAHKLYLGAKLELVNWEADSRKVMAAMREKARLQLEDEKADGTRRKVLSKDDVVDRVADLFPDEWKAQEIRRAKMKAVVDDMEHLTKRWDAKCVDIRTLLETLR